jgi:hypothetical protein
MSFDLSAIDPLRAGRIAPEPAPAPARKADDAGFADALRAQAMDARVDTIPAAPPKEVMDEVLAAQRAIEDMHSRGRTLHFEMDAGRVKILLQDLDGNTVRRIPPTEALEISSGKKVV